MIPAAMRVGWMGNRGAGGCGLARTMMLSIVRSETMGLTSGRRTRKQKYKKKLGSAG